MAFRLAQTDCGHLVSSYHEPKPFYSVHASIQILQAKKLMGPKIKFDEPCGSVGPISLSRQNVFVIGMPFCAILFVSFSNMSLSSRRRGDKRHRHNAGLQNSGKRKTLPLHYDLWRLWN